MFFFYTFWVSCPAISVVTSLPRVTSLVNISLLPPCRCESYKNNNTGDPLHSRALAHSRAPLFTQPCPHCSHSRAPGEQWARLCVFTLHGCVQAARLCRGSPVNKVRLWNPKNELSLQAFCSHCDLYMCCYVTRNGNIPVSVQYNGDTTCFMVLCNNWTCVMIYCINQRIGNTIM